jgi:hypothetical protein
MAKQAMHKMHCPYCFNNRQLQPSGYSSLSPYERIQSRFAADLIFKDFRMPNQSLNARIPAYKNAFASGELQQTYQALVGIVQNLRTEFSKKYEGEFAVANILHGYIDFTYFYPERLSEKQKAQARTGAESSKR